MGTLGLVTPERDRISVLIELVRVANAATLDLAEDLRLADVEQAPRLVGDRVPQRQPRACALLAGLCWSGLESSCMRAPRLLYRPPTLPTVDKYVAAWLTRGHRPIRGVS